MDSAIECFTFALNSLGYAARPSDFRDMTERHSLKQIGPADIFGSHVPGYERLFPTLAAHWKESRSLIQTIADNHDVSKHREAVFLGGQASRQAAPAGFFERLGITDHAQKLLVTPMEEIIISRDPKAPRTARSSTPREEQVRLEDVAQDFKRFIEQTCALALTDAKANIHLEFTELQR